MIFECSILVGRIVKLLAGRRRLLLHCHLLYQLGLGGELDILLLKFNHSFIPRRQILLHLPVVLLHFSSVCLKSFYSFGECLLLLQRRIKGNLKQKFDEPINKPVDQSINQSISQSLIQS